jgi:nicotinate-nucleotide adenylyltransferase
MHVGLYFGSFNPVHVGHLIIASYAKHTTDLDQVWLVPSPQNPLKHSSTLLNEYHRLHLVQVAIENDPHLRVTDIEFHLPKPSYTIDTLAYLEEKYPHHRFSIIMGADSFSNITHWKNYQQLLARHTLYIYPRPGFEIQETHGASYTIIDAPLLSISSTDIRQFIKKGMPIRYLVPDAAAREIEENNYYR